MPTVTLTTDGSTLWRML